MTFRSISPANHENQNVVFSMRLDYKNRKSPQIAALSTPAVPRLSRGWGGLLKCNYSAPYLKYKPLFDEGL